VRYATLTHNCHNIYADAAVTELRGGNVEKSTPLWGGVSPAGRKIIKEMNRLGVLVDLAHVSRDTMLDVLGGGSGNWTGSAAPPIFSHSCAYSLCPHPRNVPDEVLHLVKAKGSVVMVNFMPDFVSCVAADPPNSSGLPDFDEAGSTLGRVADHVVYIGELIGFEHVGIGSDYDGIGRTPRGLENVTKFPDLVGELLRRGVSDADVAKVVGRNILRVWAEADRVALRMQEEGEMPLEDDLPSVEW
jgi:membrane dipeptidase